MIAHRFNLVEEPWIPVIGKERVSLKQLFSSPDCAEIGGNPIQKISIIKLLLAIAQSAHTPKDEDACKELGAQGLAKHCLTYLEKQKGDFWLFGERPFLQMPEIKKAKPQKLSAVLPEIATGNNPLVFEIQKERDLTDAEKALLIVTLMGFALGGKKTDNSVSLTEGYEKPKTGKPAAGVGHLGYLHSFVIGANVQETIWLNLFTQTQLTKINGWQKGLGTAPWECMPKGENCPIARDLKESYLGRLVPLSRFCLLTDEGLHYSDGISFSSHKEGGVDPSVAVDRNKKEWKASWTDPEKRPWRMITSFLSYLGKTKTNSYECLFIREGLTKAMWVPTIGIWSGGLRVSGNAGEQFVAGSDDFVESKIFLSADCIGNNEQFWQIEEEMKILDQFSETVRKSVLNYYNQLKVNGVKHTQIAVNLFWQLCEKYAQTLFQANDPKSLRLKFKSIAEDVYDYQCSKETARQISSWTNNRPKIKIS